MTIVERLRSSPNAARAFSYLLLSAEHARGSDKELAQKMVSMATLIAEKYVIGSDEVLSVIGDWRPSDVEANRQLEVILHSGL